MTTGTQSHRTVAHLRVRSSAGTIARAAHRPRRTSARLSAAMASKLPARSVMTTTATTTTGATAPASLKRATPVRPQTAHYPSAGPCAGTGIRLVMRNATKVTRSRATGAHQLARSSADTRALGARQPLRTSAHRVAGTGTWRLTKHATMVTRMITTAAPTAASSHAAVTG